MIVEENQCSLLISTASGNSLRMGDIISFAGIRWWPWYKRLWYHFRYMRHNNPMFKPIELRQFVVTGINNGTQIVQ